MCEVGFDGDAATVWHEERVKARKPHRCASCSAVISPRETYLRHSCLFDGGWCREAVCLPCLEARSTFVAEHPAALIPHPDSLQETLEQCIEWDEISAEKWGPVLEALKARAAAASARVAP